MPFTYLRDDVQRRIVIAFHGLFKAEESLASIHRRGAEVGAASYGVLYDLRGLTGSPSTAELKSFMSAETPQAKAGDPEPPRGPFAILVTNSELYSAACTFRALGRSKVNIEVFRDFAEADAWLTKEKID